MTPLELDDRLAEIEARLDRIEKAIKTTAAWLAQTPGVWGVQDTRGIEDILEPKDATEGGNR